MKYVIALLASLFMTQASAQGTLILAIDVSDSVDVLEMELQMKGYANTLEYFPYLENVEVETVLFNHTAISVARGPVSASYNFFNNFDPWSYMIQKQMNPPTQSSTCTHKVLEHVLANIDSYPPPVILDISTDGKENCFNSNPLLLVEQLIAYGVQINTIVIGTEDMGILEFNKSITTNTMFLAKDFVDFELILYEKLAMEVSQLR